METINLIQKVKSAKTILFFCFLIPLQLLGQSWPVTTENRARKITVFKPAVENWQNNVIDFRAAIAVLEKDENAPVFGSIWGSGKLRENNSGKTVNLWSVMIDDIRFPDGITEVQLIELAGEIEDAINARQPELVIDDIVNDQLYAEQEREQAAKINNNPPRIYYSDEATILVNIDGDPIIQRTDVSGVEMVVNTPFLILKFSNNFYLGNGTLWYKSASIPGNFLPERNVPNAVFNAAYSLKTSDEVGIGDYTEGFYPKIIISLEPAELVQTDGPALFSAIQGTNILFVSNTEEHLLLDISRQAYFVLLSGRWFTATKLDGTWKYVQPDKVPTDFAKIPEGSEKDAVLASISGTRASKEAVRNSMVPQAAVVDRNSATSSVIYDGSPEFEPIQNTNLQMAVNSSNTVIVERDRFYLVDNGIWFVANSPQGPWYVSDYRPAQVVYIPPSSPAYNVKYVEIYYSTPTVVYVGYTSGYVSSYVYNNVVIYGTGYRYRPWRGYYYYPRPYTYGFGMTYNPWYGWTITTYYGIGGYGWFAYGYPHYYYPPGYYYRHGWWGPPIYRPPYRIPYSHCYGHHPAYHRPIHYSSSNVSSRPVYGSRPTTNIYGTQSRPGVVSSRPAVTSRPTDSRENYNYSHAARPTTGSSRPDVSQGSTTRPGTSTRPDSNTSTRPGTSQTDNQQPGTRPGTGNVTETRPSTRPDSNTTTTRPGSSQTGTQQPGTRPGTSGGTETRPSTRPESSATTTRPSTPQTGTQQTGNRQNTNSGAETQPSTRPESNTQTTRPSTPQTGTQQSGSRPGSSSGTETRPSTRPEPNTPTARPGNSQTSTQQTTGTRQTQTTTGSSNSNSNRQQSGSSVSGGSSSSSNSSSQVGSSNSSSSRQQSSSSSSSSGSSSGNSRSNQQNGSRR